ncbi:phage baseplate assembly protein V [Pyxidicoccus sp. 3LFB2]
MKALPVPPSIHVELDGLPLDPRAVDDLISFTVEHSAGLTSKFTLQLRTWNDVTSRYSWVDDTLFTLGSKLELLMGFGTAPRVSLIAGEVTDIELKTDANAAPRLEVSGLDPRHALAREQKTRRFNEKTLGAIVRRIAGEHRLSVGNVPRADVGSRTQYNQTDLEFLNGLAADHGCELVISTAGGQKALSFQAQESGPSATLKLGEELLEFTPRISSQSLVSKVTVRSSSPDGEEVLVESAVIRASLPSGQKRSGLRNGKELKARGHRIITNRPVNSRDEARELARAELERIVSSAVTGSGRCLGRPELRVGGTLAIKAVGNRFSGQYHLTQVTHTFSVEEGFRTAFEVQGGPRVPDSVSTSKAPVQGLAVARVNQTDEQGRVTLHIPWLAPDYVSDWVRVVTPLAGKGHGLYLPFQVDDEVLVAFEQGDIDRPFVLGGVWSTQATPPDKPEGATSGEGEKRQYALRTPGGLSLWFDDKARRITLGDGGKTQLVIDAEAGSVTLTADQDLSMKAGGALTLQCRELSAEADQRGSVKAAQGLALNSSAGIKLNDGALEVV